MTNPQQQRYADFAQWISEASARAGFRVDIRRSGALQCLAGAVGTAQSTVHRVLTGQRVPAHRFWPAWAAALQVDYADFERRAQRALCGEAGPRLIALGGVDRELRAPRLIGLSGPARCGKDTLAEAFVEAGWARRAFADKVKGFLYGLDPWLPDDEVNGSFPLAEEVDRYGWDWVKDEHPVVREYLQRCGTEAGRQVLGETVWVDALFRDSETWGPTVISDVRFPNEAQAIKDRGGIVVKIHRPKQMLIDGADHISENALKGWDFDVTVINSGTIEDLHKSAECLRRPL